MGRLRERGLARTIRNRLTEIPALRQFPRLMAFWSSREIVISARAFAAEQLGLRGYETFLPMIQAKRASAPLFTGYFFMRIVEQWR